MTKDDYDTPWKEILGRFFEPFMAFFFPRAHREIDWSRGFVLLDKELARITRGATLGPRVADKLIKVWRNDATSRLVLVHIEAQNQRQEDFEKRIFVYNYRIFDLYELPVVSLAVLGDDSPSWRPTCFGWEVWGCSLELRFPIVKLVDFERDLRVVEGEEPMAILVAAHLAMRRTRKNLGGRLSEKLRLCRGLYQKGLDKEEILALYRLIDWLLTLPEELEQEFLNKHGAFEEEVSMQYITSAERLGMQRGVAKGMQQGAAAVLERLLRRRFGSLDQEALEALRQAEPGQLEQWAEKVLDAPSLRAVFAGPDEVSRARS